MKHVLHTLLASVAVLVTVASSNSSVLKSVRASESVIKQACLSVFLGCCTDSSECVMQAKVEESTRSLAKEVDQAKKERAVTTSS